MNPDKERDLLFLVATALIAVLVFIVLYGYVFPVAQADACDRVTQHDRHAVCVPIQSALLPNRHSNG